MLPTTTTPADEKQPFPRRSSIISFLSAAALLFVSVWTRPSEDIFSETVTEKRVWYFGLITALSTGLGVLPFACVSKPKKVMFGIANAVAAGMMMSASVGLLSQGCRCIDNGALGGWRSVQRTALGAILGFVFILGAKRLLGGHEEENSLQNLTSLSAKKVLLFLFVMTIHSFSEGVGIGVSFAGDNGA